MKTRDELLGDAYWPAYGLPRIEDTVQHCHMHYTIL